MTDMTEAPLVPEVRAPTSGDAGFSKAASKLLAPSKSDSVTKLLRRAKGATIAELQEATAWQSHSLRAFLSGLRKKGSAVSKEQRKSGETAYRIQGKAPSSVAAHA